MEPASPQPTSRRRPAIRALAGRIFVCLLAAWLLGGGLALAADTVPDQGIIGRIVSKLTGGQVQVSGVSGALTGNLRVERVELTDADGTWLRIDDLTVTWSPSRLLTGELLVEKLTASRLTALRPPVVSAPADSGGSGFSLPVAIDVQELHLDRIEIAETVFGTATAFSAEGRLALPSLEKAEGRLALRRLDKQGEYDLTLQQDQARLQSKLTVREPEGGLLGNFAGLPPAPLTLDATAEGPRADLATRIVLEAGKLQAQADGTLHLDRTAGELTLTLNELGPFIALAGIELQGSTKLDLRVARTDATTHLEADGRITVTAGPEPLPALTGRDARLRVVADLQDGIVRLQQFVLTGEALHASASGTVGPEAIELGWNVEVTKPQLLAPQLAGTWKAEGNVSGKPTDLTASADLSGTVAPPGIEPGALTAHIEAKGLPGSPAARLTTTGQLAGAPLELALDVARLEDGTLRAAIDKAEWRSARANGQIALPPGATVPLGHLDLQFRNLADLAPLLGQPMSGSVTASLDSTKERTRLQLEARNAGLNGGASAGLVRFDVVVPDPANPIASVDLLAEALRIPGVPDRVRLTSRAQIDVARRVATISALNAAWQQEQLRLLSQVQISIGDTVAIDNLRLGLRQAVLEASGRVSPTLDLTASLRGVTADLARVFVPGLEAEGSLRADAKLAGTPARPTGTIRIDASGLRSTSGTARALPPGNLTATARLREGDARIDARLSAGSAALTLDGTVPISGGAIELRAQGAANLAMLEPLIAASGRRVAGRAALNVNLRGTLADPQIEGRLTIANGTVQDYTTGLHLTAINATLRGDGGTLRIERFTARAGPQGRIDVAGTIGVLAPGMPVDLTLTARNARPISSDVLTATLGADLTLRGEAASDLLLSGKVDLQRVEIRIPERLPASLPVLNVIRPGDKPPPPATPGPAIRLDLTVNAPGQIFLRGRGLDAELGGNVHIGGTLSNPEPDGRFQIRRGDFSLAGQTITFDKGEIGFDGGSLTNPSLNFLASRAGTGITAYLALTGTARAPKITLSSSPKLPQDEVLAQLLLGRSAASLQPLELAQIASALASLTGTSSGLDPLNSVRSGLGLDRLSIGGGGGGGSTLDAGRYVAPGVYLGARQSLSGTGTQSVVQIDITKGLKLEGTVGTGTASATGTEGSQGTGVGLIYQLDY